MLAYEKKTYNVVNFQDLQKFILEHTGQEYRIPHNENCNNGSKLIYTLTGEFWDDDTSEYENYKKTGKPYDGWSGQYILDLILQGLCHEKLIEPGDYLISVFW